MSTATKTALPAARPQQRPPAGPANGSAAGGRSPAGKPAQPAGQGILYEVQVRNDTLLRAWQHSVQLNKIMGIALVASIAMNAYSILTPTRPLYFASENGRVIPMVPLNEPMLRDSDILAFAVSAAMESYSFNYSNYQTAFQNASQNFTPEGWASFAQSLEQSRNLEAVINRKLIVTAAATQGATILERNVDPVSGRYYWIVQFPIVVTYESLSERKPQTGTAEVTVVRRDTAEHERGIGVASLRII